MQGGSLAAGSPTTRERLLELLNLGGLGASLDVESKVSCQVVDGRKFLELMTAFIDHDGAKVLRGELALKLNPSCLQYLAGRLAALHRLGELKVSAPIDYLRSYISHMGDHRHVERVAAFLGRVPALKLVSSLSGPGRDSTPIPFHLFANLTVLEVHRCNLPSPGSSGWSALRRRLLILRCYDAVDSLRQMLAPGPADDAASAGPAAGAARYADIPAPRKGAVRAADTLVAAGSPTIGRTSEDVPRTSIGGLSTEISAWGEENQNHSSQHNTDSAARNLVGDGSYGPGAGASSGVWERLASVTCSHSQLTSLDDSLALLPAVTHLDLSRNAIASISQLHTCVRLESLDLGFNRISSTVGWNRTVGNIRVLVLRYNALGSTAGLEKLYSLEELDLSCNLLASWEHVRRLSPLPCLTKLWLMGNPLSVHRKYRHLVLSFFPSRLQQLTLDSWETTTGEQTRVGRMVDRRRQREAGANYPHTVIRHGAVTSSHSSLPLDGAGASDSAVVGSNSWELEGMAASIGSDASNQSGPRDAPGNPLVAKDQMAGWPGQGKDNVEGGLGMGAAGQLPGGWLVAAAALASSAELLLAGGPSAWRPASGVAMPAYTSGARDPQEQAQSMTPSRAKRPHRRVAPIEDPSRDNTGGDRRVLGKGWGSSVALFQLDDLDDNGGADHPRTHRDREPDASSVSSGVHPGTLTGGVHAGISAERRQQGSKDWSWRCSRASCDGAGGNEPPAVWATDVNTGGAGGDGGGGVMRPPSIGTCASRDAGHVHHPSSQALGLHCHALEGVAIHHDIIHHGVIRQDGASAPVDASGGVVGAAGGAAENAPPGMPRRVRSGSDLSSSATTGTRSGSDESARAVWGWGGPGGVAGGVLGADASDTNNSAAWLQLMQRAEAFHREGGTCWLRVFSEYMTQLEGGGHAGHTQEGGANVAQKLGGSPPAAAAASCTGHCGQEGVLASGFDPVMRAGSPTGAEEVAVASIRDVHIEPAVPAVSTVASAARSAETAGQVCGQAEEGRRDGGEAGAMAGSADVSATTGQALTMHVTPVVRMPFDKQGSDSSLRNSDAMSTGSDEGEEEEEDAMGRDDAGDGVGACSPKYRPPSSSTLPPVTVSPGYEDSPRFGGAGGGLQPLACASPVGGPSHGFSPNALWEVQAGIYTPASEGGLLPGDSPPRFDDSILRACRSASSDVGEENVNSGSSSCRRGKAKSRRWASRGGGRSEQGGVSGEETVDGAVGYEGKETGASSQLWKEVHVGSEAARDGFQLSSLSSSSSRGSSCWYETSSDESEGGRLDSEAAAGQGGERGGGGGRDVSGTASPAGWRVREGFAGLV
eukprot:jgi/Mesvir1/22722/Mv14130-RA.1